MRICSLLPSATEIVAELGLAESLVAVSEECDWPPEVGNLPVVTASRIDTAQLSSLEIEQAVRQQVSDLRPLYAIDGDLLETLEPDLILTQDLCAVCAVSADTVDELCATDAEVVALDAHTLAEIEKRIVWLGDLLGVAARGRMVAQEMEATIATVSERVAGAPQRPVFVAEWLEPPYAAGHWIPEMVALAGGRDVLGRPGVSLLPDVLGAGARAPARVGHRRPMRLRPRARCTRSDAASAGLPRGRRRLQRLLRPSGPAPRRRRETACLPDPPRASRRSRAPLHRASELGGRLRSAWTSVA
jgi:iron complex transport system substrate-binding protein